MLHVRPTYLVLLALGKKNAISHDASQVLPHSVGLFKIVDLGHQQLAQGLGVDRDHPFEITGNIVADEAFPRERLDPLADLFIRGVKEE